MIPDEDLVRDVDWIVSLMLERDKTNGRILVTRSLSLYDIQRLLLERDIRDRVVVMLPFPEALSYRTEYARALVAAAVLRGYLEESPTSVAAIGQHCWKPTEALQREKLNITFVVDKSVPKDTVYVFDGSRYFVGIDPARGKNGRR